MLKIAVVERHKGLKETGLGVVKGFGFKSGAIATTISHDSHNIIAVGTNDEDIAAAVNKLQEIGGGLTIIKMGKSSIQYRCRLQGYYPTNLQSK